MASPVQLGFEVPSSSSAGAAGPVAKMTVRRSMLTALLMSGTPEYEFDDDSDSSDSSDCEGDCGDGDCDTGVSCSPSSQPIDIPRSP
jgi:hypothetical protein